MWFDCLRVVRIYYIVFLFVKTENNNFIKEIKHVVCASIACWKPGQNLWEFSSRWKTLDRVSGFHRSALEYSQFLNIMLRCVFFNIRSAVATKRAIFVFLTYYILKHKNLISVSGKPQSIE